MKRAALAYACRFGWSVFPVAADGRSPLIKRGCHAASCEPEIIERWWMRHPAANVALACGPGSGVLALDIDRKGDIDGFAALAELEAEFEPLPATVASTTPSGGKHFLFACPDRPVSNRVGLKRYHANGSRRLYQGLDVRAGGASICLPPSRKASGTYTWITPPGACELAAVPSWLLELMVSEPPPRPPRPAARLEGPERAARYVCAAIDGECGELAATPAGGGRNQRLFIAACRLGSLVGADVVREDLVEDALERAAADCGLARDDGLQSVRATIRSGLTRGVLHPREIAA